MQAKGNQRTSIAHYQTGASGSAAADEFGGIELSPELRAELLDPEAWGAVLEEYAHTVKLAVALTDVEGHLIGVCHNPQPVWSLARDAKPDWGPGCPFCLPPSRCTALADAFRTARPALVHEPAGFAHVAIPLSLGDHNLGALIAGQVFDRHPESLSLQRAAKEIGVSGQQLSQLSSQQFPVSRTNLWTYGNLLCTLGQAFLRQRYGAILERKLIETNRLFRLLIDGVRDYALFTVDAAGYVTSWNSGAERLLGYTEAEMIGKEYSRIFTPEDNQNSVPQKELLTAEREGRAHGEGWHLRKDGSRVFVAGTMASLGDAERREFGKIIQDVTERKRSEDLLRSLNADLQHFAYATSHDLQEPLRMVKSYTQLLAQRYKGKLDEQADEFIAFAVEGAQRMESLLRDLREYWSVNEQRPVQPIPVDSNLVIEKALNFLSIAMGESGGLVTHDPLPTVMAEEVPLALLFQNLIGNALKYHRSGALPRIHVSSQRSANVWNFSVSDNGIGIEAKQLERIFAPFKRLHGTEYPGNGIGLAICQKIVERYEGRIWAESAPGEGSTFYFTIPADRQMNA